MECNQSIKSSQSKCVNLIQEEVIDKNTIVTNRVIMTLTEKMTYTLMRNIYCSMTQNESKCKCSNV